MYTRQATKFDIIQLKYLFDQYRVFYKQKSNIDAAKKFIIERFRLNDSHIIVSLNNNDVITGFTQLYPSYSSVSMQKTYILNDLFVIDKYRKKGVGKALLIAAKQFTISHNGKGLTLETAIDNPAQQLYTRLNWKKDEKVLHFTWMPKYEKQ